MPGVWHENMLDCLYHVSLYPGTVLSDELWRNLEYRRNPECSGRLTNAIEQG